MTPDLPPWLVQPARDLSGICDRGQVPQALLIHGSPGTGRRRLGLWLAGRLLGRVVPAVSQAADQAELLHPDFLSVQLLEDKESILVDQVRDLIGFLQLTSHQGGARVVMCSPADAMTRQAANSLLKTLEEPPANAVIILVSATPAGLPATILSRCYRLRVSPPSRAVALAWLRQQDEGPDWELLLDFAADAPMAALDLHRSGFGSHAADFLAQLRNLGRGTQTPVEVARKWAKADREILLRWLYLQAARSVRDACVGPVPDSARKVVGRRLQNQQKPTNMQSRFECLRDIEGLYANRHKALNMELQLSALLQRWYGESLGQ
jgi:DNA polymerase-3 subunit delta'